MQKIATDNAEYFVRVSDGLISTLFEKKAYSDMFVALMSLRTYGADQSDKADNFLRSTVCKNIFGRRQVMENEKLLEMFPGPMAVQLGRKQLKFIQENEYFITEKSDGIRAMMLMLHDANFPRFARKDNGMVFPLIDCCAFDATVKYLMENGVQQVKLNALKYDGKEYNIRLHEQKILLTDLEDNVDIEIVKRKGWSFTFLFDRTFQFYLCWEEFAFPTYETKKNKWRMPHFQNVLLVDGEIVFNIPSKRLNYSIYDVITYCKSEVSDASAQHFKSAVVSCLNMSMKDRYDRIVNQIVEPHHYYLQNCVPPQQHAPASLLIVRKNFYAKAELNEVFSCIKLDPKSGHYFYKNYNRNDGLVFTPVSETLYQFRSGACKYLLKWKWPDKLTCDFAILPHDEGGDICELYYVYRSSHTFYRQCRVRNLPQMLQKHDLKHGFLIAECSFDHKHQEWFIEVVRVDKDYANAHKTIASTIENILENITIDDLRSICLGNALVNQNAELEQRYAQATKNMLCHFRIAFNNQTGQFFLQCKIPKSYQPNSKYDSWLNYLDISECMGPNNQDGSQLSTTVQELMPGEGYLFCMARYVPMEGTWRIEKFQQADENMATASILLETLEKCVCAYQACKAQLNKIRSADDTSQEPPTKKQKVE